MNNFTVKCIEARALIESVSRDLRHDVRPNEPNCIEELRELFSACEIFCRVDLEPAQVLREVDANQKR